MPTAGLPIVLLHGVGLDDSLWARLIAQDSLADRDVVPVELPGHGRRPPLREPATLAGFAADVAARIPQRAHLVGFSLGALVAQQIAVGEPARVATLTCVSSVCGRGEAEAAAVRARLEAARDDFAAGVEAAIQRWFPESSSVPTTSVEQIRAVLLANDHESYLHAYDVFATGDRQIHAALPRICAPTLAVTGSDDPGSTPEMTRRLARLIPHARAQIIDGARHMLPTERPDRIARLIAEFIDVAERTVTGVHHPA